MIRDHELAGLAMTLSRDHQMTITVGGEGSYCTADGSRINIARMPATPLGRALMTGLVFHEVGHKIHTHGEKPPGLLGDLTNIIEDVRIEHKTMQERPGTRYELEAVTAHYVNMDALTPNDLPTALCAQVMAIGRLTLLKQECTRPMLDAAGALLTEGFGARFVAEVETFLVKGYPALSSTADARQLAENVLALLRKQEKQPPPNQVIPPKDQGQGESKSGVKINEKSGENGEQQEGEGEEQNSTGNSGDGGSQESRKTSVTVAEEPTSRSVEEASIEQMIAKGASGFGDLSQLITRELDELAGKEPIRVNEALPELPLVGRHRHRGGKLDEVAAISTSSRMRARLLGLLQAVKRQPDSYGCSGRRLASKRLVRLALGDPKLFRRRVDSPAVNTAVMILLDLSGSMAGVDGRGVMRSSVANPAAFALHHCLARIPGVKVAAAEFSSREPDQPSVNLLGDFGEKPGSECFNILPSGGTPTHSALWLARAALLQRSEPRKVALILTDGHPCEPVKTAAATRRCIKDGIEIVAIGILTDAVRRFWKNYQVISNLEDLPTAIFGAMEKLLVQGNDKERKIV